MLRTLHQTTIILCCLAASLLLAWKVLQPFNYGYSFWYEQLDIAPHISKYAAQNRQGKPGFETTDRQQHESLFRSIATAVNKGGEGLRSLRYQPHGTGDTTVLLTDAEATHLEDVARLIDIMLPVGWLALGGLLILLVPVLLAGYPVPGLTTSLLTLGAIALIGTLIIILIGPHDVFKALHIAVFPAEHQWFFFYQDSLMTTLMKAPDIFFAIGALWAALAACIFIALSWLLRLVGRTTRATAN